MYDLITIGNITIDLFFQGDCLTIKDNRIQLALGGKYFVDHFSESVGGGGANVAIGASKQGIKTAVIGNVGRNPFQKIIFAKLHEAKVATELITEVDNYLCISAVLLAKNGEKSIINYGNSHQHIFSNEKDLNRLLKTKIVYMGNLPHVSMTEKEMTLSFLRKNHIPTVVNLGVVDCRREEKQLQQLLRYIDILILNGHEFAELTKKSYDRLDFNTEFINKFSALQDKLLVVTDGEKGSYAYYQSHYFSQLAEPVNKIIDTSGCGDGYTAGFIAEYLKTKDIQKSMLCGAQYAAKILKKIGAN